MALYSMARSTEYGENTLIAKSILNPFTRMELLQLDTLDSQSENIHNLKLCIW